MPEIQLRNVSKGFGAVSVISDITLTINAGELIVFLARPGPGSPRCSE